MDMVLTGRRITGVEAGEWGLVSRVTKEGESVVDEAVKIGEEIAGFGRVATQAGKEAVNGGEYRRTTDTPIAYPSTRAPAGARSATRKEAVPAVVRDSGSKRG
jgi:enoyl-CoA hydratase